MSPARVFRGLVRLLVSVVVVALFSSQLLAQAGIFLYVPNQVSNNVSIYSINADGTLTAVTTLPAGTGPAGAYVRGDQAFAYVINRDSDNISVIDTKTQTVVQTFPAGNEPQQAAISPNGSRLYITNRSDDNVSVLAIDALTGQLSTVTTINVGDQPRGIAINPDGSRLYVVNQSADNVSVINTATNLVVATTPVGDQPLHVTVNPAGTRVYVSNFSTNNVSIIDASTNTVVNTVPVAASPTDVVVSPDGGHYYVLHHGLGIISHFDAATDTEILPAVIVGLTAFGLEISPDGSFAYASSVAGDNIFMYTISGGALTSNGTIAAGTDPAWAAICNNGNGMLTTGATFVANTAAALYSTGINGAIFTGGTLYVNDNNLTFTTPITLGTEGGIINTNGNNATISSVMAGTGSLTKTGAGMLTLSGVNTYTGTTTVSGGTLKLATGATLNGNIVVNAGTTVIIDGTITGTITNNGGTVQYPSAVITSGNGLSSPILNTVGPLVVTVRGPSQNPIQGVTVNFALASAPLGAFGQSLSAASAVTDANGQASANLTLGSVVGQYSVTASSPAIPGSSLEFVATAVNGSPSQIVKVSGDLQTTAVNDTLKSQLVVRVVDVGGNPVAGVTISFKFVETPFGAVGHSLTPTGMTTNAQGRAVSTARLGSAVGEYTISATSPQLSSASVAFRVTGTPPTSVEATGAVPNEFTLKPLYPNPFNPTTTIQFGLPERSLVRLEVYDLTGKLIASLLEGELSAGTYTTQWSAQHAASGTYLVRMQATSSQSKKIFEETSRVVLLK